MTGYLISRHAHVRIDQRKPTPEQLAAALCGRQVWHEGALHCYSSRNRWSVVLIPGDSVVATVVRLRGWEIKRFNRLYRTIKARLSEAAGEY